MERLAAYVPDLALSWDRSGGAWSVRDASMMFADLSGFTKLSERVARVPGAGAEVVKRTINSVFEPCIDVVLREGGDVVKFAGDGLMMMFEGDGHEFAAARAAVALQRAVQRIGRVETPAGPARIGVSIGISSGDFLCMLADAGRIEPVVVGDAIDAMFAAETIAKSGQTVVDAQLASRLPRGTTRRLRGSDALQLRPDAPELAPRTSEPHRRAGADANAPGVFLDPRVRAALESGDPPPEHRSAAIAFVALGGLTEIRRRDGVEGLHATIERFFDAVDRASATTGACWLESDSDRDQVRVLLTAGAPYRTDVDEQRMVDAVWRIRTATEGMPVRAGISRGKVFVGDVGHPLRRTYNVMGDAVNVAARLAGKAEPGQVLALQTVARAPRSMALVVEHPPLQVKGKRAPLEVCVIAGLRATDDAVEARTAAVAPPTGRTAELARITACIDVLGGDGARRGGALAVVGESGMGKSHLVAAAVSAWNGPSLRTSAHQFESTTPFAGSARLVRAALGIDPLAPPDAAGRALADVVERMAPDLAERAPLVAEAIRAEMASTTVVDAIRPEFRLEQTAAVTVALLRRLVTAPTVLVIDDADRLDPASSAVLAAIVGATDEQAWVVVITHAPGTASVLIDAVEAIGPSVLLAPLGPDEIRRIVVAASGDAGLTSRAVELVVRYAGGNPMMARELTLGWRAGAQDVDLPDAVERAVASRIDNLAPRARMLIRDLAVTGAGAEWSLVRAVVGDAADDAAAWAELEEYVHRVAGAVVFDRDIYAVAAYQGLAHERRRTLHRAAAAELARRPYARFEAARIADHAHAGGDHRLAWEWSRAAAATAAATGSVEDAAVHLGHAIAAADAGAGVATADVGAVLEELGDAHERAGHPDEAHAAYRRARTLTTAEPLTVVRLLRKQARVAERAGAWTASLGWVTRGLRMLEGLDEHAVDTIALRADLELGSALIRFYQGRLRQSAELADQAARHADLAGAKRTMAQAELQLEMTCSELGRADRAAHGLRALELFELLDDHLGLANLRLNLGVSCYNEGRWDEAIHHYGRSIAEYEVVGDLLGAASTANNRAEILTDQGRLDEATDSLHEARRGLMASNFRLGVAITSSGFGRIATHRGDFERAEAWLDDARGHFVDLDAASLVADTDVRRLELDVWRGEPRRALADLERAQAAADESGPSPLLTAAIGRFEAWARCATLAARSESGRRRAATAVWERAIAGARASGFPYEVALALDGLVVTGGRADPDVVAERDRLLVRLGVVLPPRPPWTGTVSPPAG